MNVAPYCQRRGVRSGLEERAARRAVVVDVVPCERRSSTGCRATSSRRAAGSRRTWRAGDRIDSHLNDGPISDIESWFCVDSSGTKRLARAIRLPLAADLEHAFELVVLRHLIGDLGRRILQLGEELHLLAGRPG